MTTRTHQVETHHVETQDDGRIEIIANGPPFGGVDTTLVSPSREPVTHACGEGNAEAQHQKTRGEQGTNLPRTPPGWTMPPWPSGIEVGRRWSDETATVLRVLADTKHGRAQPFCASPPPLIHRCDPPLERHSHASGHACFRIFSLLAEDLFTVVAATLGATRAGAKAASASKTALGEQIADVLLSQKRVYVEETTHKYELWKQINYKTFFSFQVVNRQQRYKI